MGLLFALVVARLADVQVLHAQRYVSYGDQQRLRSRVLPAPRGSLFDRNGASLAMSVAQRTVYADPTKVVDRTALAQRLSPLLGVDVATLERRLSAKGHFAVLAHTVPDAVAAQVTALNAPGIATYDEFKRFQPSGELARSLIGKVSIDGARGTSGLEAQFNGALAGRDGHEQFEKANGGGTIAGGHQAVDEPRPGSNLYLTIDQALQFETERALGDEVRAARAKGAMAIISRPRTGEVLAMANVVASSDGATVGPSDVNGAVTTSFEPGSVNKVITIAGALEEGVGRPDTVLSVPDHLQVADHNFTDHDPHPVRQWTVTDILAASSNVGTITLAQRLGADRLDAYLRTFGFGKQTGLGLPFESAGQMLNRRDWSGTSIGAIAIGQGVAVTAMQMLTAVNVIANDGVYVAPKLVGAIDNGQGRHSTPAAAARRVVSPMTAQQMQAMMAEVVKSGTGQEAAIPGYPVAGKTGTARKPQNVNKLDGYRDAAGLYHYVSTFAGFVPANNPGLSMIVVIDEPTTSIFASDVAAPVFARLASYALRQFHIPPPALLTGPPVAGVPQVSADARQNKGNDVTAGGQASASRSSAPSTTVAPAGTAPTTAPTTTVPSASLSPTTAPSRTAPPASGKAAGPSVTNRPTGH